MQQISPERQRELRGERADVLVRLGEKSAARQVLESAELAPGEIETLHSLQQARPQQLHRPIPEGIANYIPAVATPLRYNCFINNLKRDLEKPIFWLLKLSRF